MPPAEKFGTGSLPLLRDPLDEFERRLQILGGVEEFIFAEHGELLHFFDDGADVANGFDDVAGAGFALGANHGRAFGDAAQGFAQVTRAANERDFEIVLVDVVLFVGGSQHFAFIDVVDAESFQNARFHKVTDAGLGHDGDGDRFHDLANLADRRHARDAAFFADIGGNAFQRHDGDAPAFSAIMACSALTTSMMTPPLSISASPTLSRN